MPLPLMDKPIPPAPPGKLPQSLSAEVARREVADLVYADQVNYPVSATLTLTDRPLFQPYQTLVLQNKADPTKVYYFYPTNIAIDLNSLACVFAE